MDRYKVYLSIMGKEFCATVSADSALDAKKKVLSKLVTNIEKVDDEVKGSQQIFSSLKDIFKM